MILLATNISFGNNNNNIEKYSATARDEKNAIAYLESHEVTFKGQSVQTAKTRYLDSNQNSIGEMSSDFTQRITLPNYEYKDFRNGISHGIRLENNKIILWSKEKDGKIEKTEFQQDSFSPEVLLVGCQGLHYYLIENLENLKKIKEIPIAYFIPGKLDYYNFTLKFVKEQDDYIYLKLTIDNLFLKMFASSLELKYRKSDKRLIQFSGLSNITDSKNQMQNVSIDYNYN